MFITPFGKFLLVSNKSFDIGWKLVKELAVCNGPSSFDHFSFKKEGRILDVVFGMFIILTVRSLK